MVLKHKAVVTAVIGREDDEGVKAEIEFSLTGMSSEHAHGAAECMVRFLASLAELARDHVK